MPDYRLKDLSEEDSSEVGMGGSGKRSSGGFHLSFGVAFVLTFLAIAIAVLVGLIVHFAERDSYDRQVTCAFPETWRELFQQLFER
ncbi:hypothetical protein C0Q70_03234 [Pomacea canaliculata]|uniref:Uncharacterized protein n=1 Tax=Pomacea canaliculata TaxID=400727 RepID=A0A2T7PS58_POMCA|nr:hypothetical protein C0Q70_03234 [Pomacea canaliculata]